MRLGWLPGFGRSALAALGLVLLASGIAVARDADGSPAGSGTIHLQIVGLENAEGVVVVALFDSEEHFEAPDDPVRRASLAISDHRAEVSWHSLAFGEYAIRSFHDENGNGELDTNWVGIPKEAFGFSNDAMGRFGPPGYDDAKFLFDSDGHRLEIRLRSL
jgi:uncharacterized protein (DUF2141 family)